MIYQEEIADTQRQRATQDDESEYCARLLNYTNENRQTSYEDIHLLEFSTLQRMNLVHIQNQLAEIKADAIGHQKITQADLKSLRQLLHEYSASPCYILPSLYAKFSSCCNPRSRIPE